jgi:arginyl-tRNA synthetase
VLFDVYFAERELHRKGALRAALTRLRQLGHGYEADGASWIRTTDFGDDKDRVYVRSNGDFTYYAADCAYYLDKRKRGFDKVIIILGADHHGYIGRLRALAACSPARRHRTRAAGARHRIALLSTAIRCQASQSNPRDLSNYNCDTGAGLGGRSVQSP